MSGKAFQAVLTVGQDLENCERKKKTIGHVLTWLVLRKCKNRKKRKGRKDEKKNNNKK